MCMPEMGPVTEQCASSNMARTALLHAGVLGYMIVTGQNIYVDGDYHFMLLYCHFIDCWRTKVGDMSLPAEGDLAEISGPSFVAVF